MSLSKDSYSSGESITVTLSSPASQSKVGGFLIQARRTSGDMKTPVGQFSRFNSSQSKLTCSQFGNRGLTHTNGNEMKQMVRTVWEAPAQSAGDLVFYYAVAQDHDTFWSNQTGAKLKEASPVADKTTGAVEQPTNTPSTHKPKTTSESKPQTTKTPAAKTTGKKPELTTMKPTERTSKKAEHTSLGPSEGSTRNAEQTTMKPAVETSIPAEMTTMTPAMVTTPKGTSSGIKTAAWLVC